MGGGGGGGSKYFSPIIRTREAEKNMSSPKVQIFQGVTRRKKNGPPVQTLFWAHWIESFLGGGRRGGGGGGGGGGGF